MAKEAVWLLIWAGAVLGFAVWTWRRAGAAELWRVRAEPQPQEPCWTEEIASDGRYVYGRGQCVNDALMDLDARARAGEFDTMAGG